MDDPLVFRFCWAVVIVFIALGVVWFLVKLVQFSAEPTHRRAYPSRQVWGAEELIKAAAVADQRRTGRNRGGEITVYVTQAEAQDWHVRNHMRWLDEHGAENGVHYEVQDY